MVGTRRRDPVRHGGTAAIHATVRPQLAARRQDHQADADKRNYRDAGKGELQLSLLSHHNFVFLLKSLTTINNNIRHYNITMCVYMCLAQRQL